eukprot:COSAG02_NODE_3537_length_6594_cov_4.011239_3_plen_149_part_00
MLSLSFRCVRTSRLVLLLKYANCVVGAGSVGSKRGGLSAARRAVRRVVLRVAKLIGQRRQGARNDGTHRRSPGAFCAMLHAVDEVENGSARTRGMLSCCSLGSEVALWIWCRRTRAPLRAKLAMSAMCFALGARPSWKRGRKWWRAVK